MKGRNARGVLLIVLIGVGTGLLALWLLGSLSGVDTNPPTYWNGLGSEVPCGRSNAAITGVGMIAGIVATAGILWVLASRSDRQVRR